MSDIVKRPWRCDVTRNPVGTDTRMAGAPPCPCQGCRSAAYIERLEAALEDCVSYIAGDISGTSQRDGILAEARAALQTGGA